jgi:hypothetical protein
VTWWSSIVPGTPAMGVLMRPPLAVVTGETRQPDAP